MINFETSYTARIRTTPEVHASGELTHAVTSLEGVVTGMDVVEPGHELVVLELTCLVAGDDAADRLTVALSAVPGCQVEHVSDSVLLIHAGGKLEIQATVPMSNRVELARAYTPGVARVCLAIAADPSLARELTIKRNTVAVVTDGSAVLGLGNLGPEASMPVMEGKAALFKRFANIDAWPIALATNDVDEIVRAVQLIAPGFGGINLEDISAPRCFEVERRLRETLDIPVMHDDQHGTAVVVLAALRNAARLVKKDLSKLRIVMVGAGAAG
ncbi:MAG: malic enzyme-like NAD(P)-binding protein, partial [Actinomycetota bacterium]|nr:malic enzyme-like NAD(P)-binding protein [Actinomycetota bacterium]